jgi:hypothetical protein
VAHTHRQVGVAIGRGSDFYGPPANSAALVIEHTTSQLPGMTFRIARWPVRQFDAMLNVRGTGTSQSRRLVRVPEASHPNDGCRPRADGIDGSGRFGG